MFVIYKHLYAILDDFISDIKGGLVAAIGLAFPVLMIAVGGIIDISMVYNLQSRLQSAADSAVLAAASSGSTDFVQLNDLANRYFQANAPVQDAVSNMQGTLQGDGANLQYTASLQYNTFFLKLIGQVEVDLEAIAQANRKTSGVEIVMILDTTGSMGFGSSWADAKAAMHEMLQSLDDMSGGEDFYATLVPMADRINVGTDKASWMSVTPAPADWDGCFEPREQAESGFPHALSDDPAGVQAFLPTADGYHISNLSSKSFFTCPAEILGPTDDVASIQSAVEALSLGGTGRFDVGMAWAWRLLSPRWLDQWSVAGYPSEYEDRRKVVVLITDKFTAAYDFEVGGPDGQSFGWNQGSKRGFEHLVHTCNKMKEDGIEIHTVYVNGNVHGISYMQDCATDAIHYHEVTNVVNLQAALATIANDLVRVWLTQ